jgi:hypothetical protein
LTPDLDTIDALTGDRDALWTRLQATAFLTDDEKRAAIGYGPKPRVPQPLSSKFYNPSQPRVPPGSGRPSGQWTSPDNGGGGGTVPFSDSGAEGDMPTISGPDLGGDPSIGLDGTEDTATPTPDYANPDANPPVEDAARRRGGLSGSPAKEARLVAETMSANRAVERVQEVDPTWTRPSGVHNTIEGEIAQQQYVARAANERYAEIQAGGYGANRIPEGEPLPPIAPVRPPTWNENAARMFERLYPYGGATDQMDRLLNLGRDPDRGGALSIEEIGTAIRLERELGRPLYRSDRFGSDFVDRLGQTWDAVGSDWTDKNYDLNRYIASIDRKFANNAADRYVIDLSGLNPINAARVEDYLSQLPHQHRQRIRIVR